MHCRQRAFTLAELLIALGILGVIATFTIPKVLSAQQNSTFKSVSKEAISAFTGAYHSYRLTNSDAAAITPDDFISSLNYVKIQTSGQLDDEQTLGALNCDTLFPCYILHSGAAIRPELGNDFGGTASTNAIMFIVDPDGQVTDGTTNGPGKGVKIFLYVTGRVTSHGTAQSNTIVDGVAFGADATRDPSWFGWD